MNPFRTESSFPRFIRPLPAAAARALLALQLRKSAAPMSPAGAELAASALDALRAAKDAADTSLPEPVQGPLQLLSNGCYHVMVTAAGGGYSRWQGLALTRWARLQPAMAAAASATCAIWRAARSGRPPRCRLWVRRTSARSTSRPAGRSSSVANHDIEAQTEIAVSFEDDVELRRVRLTNHGPGRRTVELTSYAEIVLGPAGADAAHPAFEKLFVETRILNDAQALICSRRARAPGEPAPSLFHLLAPSSSSLMPVSLETDRARFIGRGRSIRDPQAMDDDASLSCSDGPVLDPVASIRCRVSLAAGETATLDLLTGAGSTREGCEALIRKYQLPRMRTGCWRVRPDMRSPS